MRTQHCPGISDSGCPHAVLDGLSSPAPSPSHRGSKAATVLDLRGDLSDAQSLVLHVILQVVRSQRRNPRVEGIVGLESQWIVRCRRRRSSCDGAKQAWLMGDASAVLPRGELPAVCFTQRWVQVFVGGSLDPQRRFWRSWGARRGCA